MNYYFKIFFLIYYIINNVNIRKLNKINLGGEAYAPLPMSVHASKYYIYVYM